MKVQGFIAVFALAAAGAQAQSLKNPSVEGLMFLQNGAFNNPSESARPVEFQTASGNEQITLVITREGNKLRLHSSEIAFTLPYPGRAGLDKKEALALCDVALQRFPQHERLIKNIRTAWARASRADLAAYGQYSAARQGIMNGAVDSMAADSQRIKENKDNRPWARSPSLLDEKPTPTPEPKIRDKDLKDSEKSDQQELLEKNLETIQKYYQQAGELSPE